MLLAVLGSPVASHRPVCQNQQPGAALGSWVVLPLPMERALCVRGARRKEPRARAVVRLAWLRVVDGSADAVGERVAGVFVEPAGL